MPQASDDLRAEMDKMFGDPISDAGPTQYLLDHGWTQNHDWTWSKPGIDKHNLHTIPTDEWLCILFLIHEWDEGGVS